MPDLARIRPASWGTVELRVFLSSSDDVRGERELLAGFIEEINESLAHANTRIRIRAEMWESLNGFRASETVNQDIINQLLDRSSLAVVILGSQLKPGTREELEFALAHGMPLVVLALDSKRRSKEVTDALQRVADANHLYLDQRRIGVPVERLLLRTVLGDVVESVGQDRESYVEQR